MSWGIGDDEYKRLLSTEEEFRTWCQQLTDDILNTSCEDEEEVHAVLSDNRPESFPAVAVWQYTRRNTFTRLTSNGAQRMVRSEIPPSHAGSPNP